MPEEIVVIKTVLDLSGSEQKLRRDVEKALSSSAAQNAAKNAGKKIGDSLGAGIETTRKGREDKELAHVRKLEAIAAQSNARLLDIEKRKQSQLDLIRERAIQKEIEHQRKLERETQRAANAANSLGSAISAVRGAFAAVASLGVVRLFENIARSAIDAAIAVDRQVNTLKALTGSADAAQRRFAELFALAQRTPGLTTNLALTLDNQLRILNVTEQTINRVLPAIGRLNAIAPLGDPQRFAGNLVQLITQNFERQDLKELVGNSPFAGELIKQIFDVDSPTNAKAIRESARKLGINTVEEFFTAFAEAAESNPRLQAVTESLGTRFEKLGDRITVALAPVGEAIARNILPALDDLVKKVEEVAPVIAESFRDSNVEIRATTKTVLQLVGAIEFLVQKVQQLGSKVGVSRVGFRALEAGLVISTGGAALPFLGLLEKNLRFEESIAPGPAPPSLLGGLAETIKAIADFSGEGKGNIKRDRTGSGSASKKSEVERLVDTVKELNREIGVLREASSREFNLQIKVDELQETEKTLKSIVDLRRQLNLLQVPVLAGTEDTQLAALKFLSGDRSKRQTLAPVADLRPGFKFIDELGTPIAPTAQVSIEALLRNARRDLTRSGRSIDASFSRGQLTGGEAESLSQAANREFAGRLREALALEEKKEKINQANIDQLEEEIALYDQLGASISNSERFMRGFNSQIDTVGDAFDRFGQNVSRAFTNVRDLFSGLKSAVLGFFNDLLGQSLQNLMRQTLAPLLGGIAGAFGVPSFAGAAGNIFRTPSTFPAAIAQAFAGGGGISAPASVSGVGFGSIFGGLFGGGGGGGAAAAGGSASGGGLGGFIGASVPRTAGKINFSLGALGKSFAAAAPFLGASIGAGIGGQSTGGSILGSAGGFLAGGFAAGSLGLLGTGTAAGLLSNPFTAVIGAGLLIGGALLGKAKQRKADEEAAGQLLLQSQNAIIQLKDGIAADQIDGSQASAIFENQILGQFRAGINSLKTESVRKSRLTNQVNDLRKVFNDLIPPVVAEQAARRKALADTESSNAAAEAARQARLQAAAAIHSKLIPEFATGGTTRGGLALLHAGEKVVNLQQQANMRAIGGSNIFERAGVPRINHTGVFDIGGTVPSGGGRFDQPLEINLQANVVISEKTATGIYITGGSTATGRSVTVNNVKIARTNREL